MHRTTLLVVNVILCIVGSLPTGVSLSRAAPCASVLGHPFTACRSLNLGSKFPCCWRFTLLHVNQGPPVPCSTQVRYCSASALPELSLFAHRHLARFEILRQTIFGNTALLLILAVYMSISLHPQSSVPSPPPPSPLFLLLEPR